MTQLITLASLNRPLTCAEFDSNNQALRERANHTGTQLSSTISDFGARVDGLPTIVALQLCCSDLTASIATLRDDIFGSGDLNALLTALEARVVNQINALAAVVGSQQDQITTLTLDISSIIANIQALTASTSSLQAQITSLTAVVSTKAPLNSPALTGTPTVPTAAPGTSSTQIATTAFVTAAIFPATDTSFGVVRTNTYDAVPIVYRKQEVDSLLTSYAPLTSPTFSGAARIAPGSEPLAAANDNRIPTTAWVKGVIASNIVTIPSASPATAGIIKSHSNSTNPITYLKDDIDGLLDAKAPKADPVFTGSATIPNATITGTSTIGNVTLQGSADLSVTPAITDNSTKIVNSSWVVQYVTGVTTPPPGSLGEEAETPVLMTRLSGLYSAQRRADINTLIKTLKQAAIYQVLDRLFIFAAPNVGDAMVNWITAFNASGVFSGPTNSHVVNVGLTAGSATINSVQTLTNAKPNNLTLLVDNWTKGSNISNIESSIINTNPFFEFPLFSLHPVIQLLNKVTSSTGAGPDVTSNEVTLLRNYTSPGATPIFASFHRASKTSEGSISATPIIVSGSIRDSSTSIYTNGTNSALGSKELLQLNSGAIVEQTAFEPQNFIITTGSEGFCSSAAVGSYLSPEQHQILSSAVHRYVSTYLPIGWSTYLT